MECIEKMRVKIIGGGDNRKNGAYTTLKNHKDVLLYQKEMTWMIYENKNNTWSTILSVT